MHAVGITRVSQPQDRGDKLMSPEIQREGIEQACAQRGLDLLWIRDETGISGGRSLAQRPALLAAVEAVENGSAVVIIAAYFDRLFRSLAVQAEVVKRVEAAGGQVLALDAGRVGESSASQWMNGAMLGVAAEFYRRSGKERSGAAQRRVIEEGRAIATRIAPGYERDEGGKLVPSNDAPVVLQAFEQRREGQNIKSIKAYLASHGIQRTYESIARMFFNPIYRGELVYGKLVNPDAHEAIIPEDLWRAVQTRKDSKGRKSKSPLLLARLGVLRCATCGGSLIASTQHQRGNSYAYYRCPSNSECADRPHITAKLVDETVIPVVKDALRDLQGKASHDPHLRDAEEQLSGARRDLETFLTGSEGLDAPAIRTKLTELVEGEKAAQRKLDLVTSQNKIYEIVTASRDWDSLSLQGRRELIKAVVHRATVAPGRGPNRVTVELFSESASRRVAAQR